MKHAPHFVGALVMSLLPACVQGGAAQEAGAFINQADRNADGTISREEFLSHRSAVFHKLDLDDSGTLTEPEFKLALSERGKRFSGRAFGKIDVDDDGFISPAEWEQNPPRVFDKLDRNSDGLLTPSERDRVK
ncbi:hypothetical protein [uncultured Hyphomonas sp.]|uniref:EF-hand domain-containing protein n=1 Tax=uncultured Hyphomonas sp. TaxID=225298 RepID=UPI000C535F98|nr:hypothetical protein [Hyphomonadaceae bacterium]MBA29741.1 hypothetical protein [Hyphomonadaceae bacterium]|tara:strand:- start:16983 stop:17381 length:399 start_codon:yes stop_codon:yes gene_type:complete